MNIKYEWNERHCRVFSEYINLLNQAQIEYFVLRNYEGLPEVNTSKDIDIIIRPGLYKEASLILLKCFKENGIKNYTNSKFERIHCFVGIDLENNFSIHIDLIEGYLNKGFEIFDFETLFENTIEYKNFRVLNNVYDATMLLLYKVIGVSELKEKYRQKIKQEYEKDSNSFNHILEKVFGEKYAAVLRVKLDSSDFDWFVSHSRQLSRKSKIRVFWKKPIFTCANIFLFLAEKFYRVIVCPKKYRRIIAVEAPDGTGKTTFIELLRIKMAECFVTEVSNMKEYHFRPALFPNLGAVGEKAGIMEQDTDFTNPHRGKPAGFLSSLLRISYYTLDYILGGAIFVRKDVQFGRYSIFDRYIYDFLVDPKRSKINLPYRLRVYFSKFAPKPQIVFVLKTDAETIYKRKQELTIDEINRQLVEFGKLQGIVPNYKELDAGKQPNQIVRDAMFEIVKTFSISLEGDIL